MWIKDLFETGGVKHQCESGSNGVGGIWDPLTVLSEGRMRQGNISQSSPGHCDGYSRLLTRLPIVKLKPTKLGTPVSDFFVLIWLVGLVLGLLFCFVLFVLRQGFSG